MIPQPPPGQGPIDPRGVFSPPPPPGGAAPAAGNSPGFTANAVYSSPNPEMTNPNQPNPASPGYPPQGFAPAGPMPGMMPHPGFLPPGPGFPPPPFMFGPPPRRGGAGRAIFMTLLVLVLLGSLALNLVLVVGMAGVAAGGGGYTLESTIKAGNHDQKVAVIPLFGLVDGMASSRFDRYMTQAEKNQDVKAIVIEIDSPGGTVTGSDEIYARTRRFKAQRPSVPVIVSMGSLATSGGYYAACAGDYVFAQRTTLTGNIGVLMPRFNVAKLMEKYGVEENTVVSTGATYKNAGSMFQKETEEQRVYIQGIADHAFGQFKKVVVEGRGTKLTQPIDAIANGKVYVAEEALKLGLIDDADGYLEDAVAHAATQAGLREPHVFRYQDPPTMLERILSASDSNVGVPGAGGLPGGGRVTVNNGVNINVDTAFLHELNASRPMYLHRWPAGDGQAE
jgi:protease-4